jgi:urease accessory protein
MGLGLLRGLSGSPLPPIEPLIAISVAVLGSLIAGAVQLKTGVAALLIAAFAWFHGVAHGLEVPATSQTAYMTGIFFSTALLHVLGLGIGVSLLAAGHGRVVRIAGLALCVCGLLPALP